MINDVKSSTFSITNKLGHVWMFNGLHYCLKSKTSYVSVFYSQIEKHWVFVINCGWIKVDGKVIESLLYVKEEAELEMDDSLYAFESHMTSMIGRSQDIAVSIVCSDSQSKTGDQILNLLRNTFSYYESLFVCTILQANKVFKIKDDVWTVDLTVYEEYGYHQISEVLNYEYQMGLEAGIKYKIFELNSINTSIDVDDRKLDELRYRDECFEHVQGSTYECINRTSWIEHFNLISTLNNFKRKKKNKRKVKRIRHNISVIHRPIIIDVPREVEPSVIERSFTPNYVHESFFLKRRKEVRSQSLIYKQEEDPFYVWTIECVYKNDKNKEHKF